MCLETPDLLANNIIDMLNKATIDGQPVFTMPLLGINLKDQINRINLDTATLKKLCRKMVLKMHEKMSKNHFYNINCQFYRQIKAIEIIHLGGRLHLDVELRNIAPGIEDMPKPGATLKSEFYLHGEYCL